MNCKKSKLSIVLIKEIANAVYYDGVDFFTVLVNFLAYSWICLDYESSPIVKQINLFSPYELNFIIIYYENQFFKVMERESRNFVALKDVFRLLIYFKLMH